MTPLSVSPLLLGQRNVGNPATRILRLLYSVCGVCGVGGRSSRCVWICNTVIHCLHHLATFVFTYKCVIMYPEQQKVAKQYNNYTNHLTKVTTMTDKKQMD